MEQNNVQKEPQMNLTSEINGSQKNIEYSYLVSSYLAEDSYNTTYVYPILDGELVPFLSSNEGKVLPLEFNFLSIGVNIKSVEEAIKVMQTTQHLLSTSVACSIKLGLKNEIEQVVELENVLLNVFNLSFAPLALRTAENANIVLQVRFTTKHDNMTYFINIDIEHFLANALTNTQA